MELSNTASRAFTGGSSTVTKQSGCTGISGFDQRFVLLCEKHNWTTIKGMGLPEPGQQGNTMHGTEQG